MNDAERIRAALRELHALTKALLSYEDTTYVWMLVDSLHAKLVGDEVCEDCPKISDTKNL